ncbi:MAG TPA: ATP-binding protein [Anaerolineae bacterium]|nr:ATP-binding protein [Anaerolineae bacterium]
MDLKSSLEVKAELNNLALIRDFVEETGVSLAADPVMLLDVVLAVNEIASNIMIHNYQGQPGLIEIDVGQAEDALVVRLRDEGPPFDPTTVPNPDLNLPLEKRPLGKMGIYLTRQLTDEMTHRLTSQGGNELTLVKKGILGNPKID